MLLKVVSFNTYCAPLMRGKFDRVDHIKEHIKHWHENGVDVISLQETNSYKIGPMTKIIWGILWFTELFKSHPWLMVLFEVLANFEGFFLPWFTFSYVKDSLIQCAKDSGYPYTVSSRYGGQGRGRTYGIDNGLLILSKHPFDQGFAFNQCIDFETDAVGIPGLLKSSIIIESVNNIKINLICCHLLASLESNEIEYKVARFLNKMLGKDSTAIRRSSFPIIKQNIETHTIIMCDANIDAKTKEFKEFIRSIGLKNLASDPHKKTAWENIVLGEDVIDYVLSDMQGTSYVQDDCTVSDHHPVIAEILIPGTILP